MAIDSAARAGSRVVGIEGLRGLAASGILVYHVWLYGAPGGHEVQLGLIATKFCANLISGVTLFFVLSGFLLFRPFVKSILLGRALPSIRSYIVNRALRILPAYWAILLVVALLFHRGLLRAPAQLLANMFFLQDYVPRYMPVSNGGIGIVPAWSLCVEVVFYLVLPLLAVAVARYAPARSGTMRAAAAPALLVVVGIAAKIIERVYHLGGVWQAAFPIRADWFAAGMIVAILRVRWETGELERPAPQHVAWIVGLAFGGAGASVELYDHGLLTGIEYQTPIAVACAVLLAYVVVGGERTLVARVLASRPLFLTGLASYSLFLWHDPLLRAFRGAGWTLVGGPGMVANILLVGVVAGVLSAISYVFVERPALRLRSRNRVGMRSTPESKARVLPVDRDAYQAPLEPVRTAD